MTAMNPVGARAVTRACPGGCHRQIPYPNVACGDCSPRLPYELQRALHLAYRRDPAAHECAKTEARQWLREHQPGGSS